MYFKCDLRKSLLIKDLQKLSEVLVLIESHENGSRSDRRPPDKGGWGVTCFPQMALVPTLWSTRLPGTMGTHKGRPYEVRGVAQTIFISVA